MHNASKHNITTYVGGALTQPGPKGNFICDMCGKCFRAMDVTRAQGGERALED